MPLLAFTAAALLLSSAGSRPAGASVGAHLLAADDRGVTLRLVAGDAVLEPSGVEGRQRLHVPGLRVAEQPGRPQLPYASALVALPPGARAEARVLSTSAERTREGVLLTHGDRPTFEAVPGMTREVPTFQAVEPLREGPWPRGQVDVGAPLTIRRQKVVAVRIHPFRYDEVSRRLWSHDTVVVRVDFVGGTQPQRGGIVEQDRFWEPVLREAIVNYEQARPWRAPRAERLERRTAPSRAGRTAAFDEDGPEVRVRVDTTGVYWLDFADLQARGYPANTPVNFVSVHRHEFVEGATPAYETIELPIEVEDRNTNQIFDTGDRIVVYVQNWAERSGATIPQREWGDAEVIYATALSNPGLRVARRAGWRGTAGLTPLESYPWRQRWEHSSRYFSLPEDTTADQFHWTDFVAYYQRPDTIRIATNHIDQSQQIMFSATWQGRRQGPHYSWAQVRNGTTGVFSTVADSVLWTNKISRTVTAILPGTALGEGNVNTFRNWGKGAHGSPNQSTNSNDLGVGLNYLTATYWRRFRALSGYLDCNSATAAGEFQIRAEGFTAAAIRIYDVTNPTAPVALDVDPSHVIQQGNEFAIEFQDSVDTGLRRSYVAFTRAKRVPAGAFTAVTRRSLATQPPADYLLIAPEAFLPAAGTLATFRTGQGLKVLVCPVEAVFDEYSGGRKSSYAIRRLLQHAYDNWNTRFVLLLGDGSEDPLNRTGYAGPDWVPVQKISAPVGISLGREIVPSDPWYACVDEPCDLLDFEPDVPGLFLGRLPAQDLQQATDMVDKIIKYESYSVTQDWRSKVMLSADDEFSGEPFFGGGGTVSGYCRRPGEDRFRLLSETIASLVANDAGLRNTLLERFYLNVFLADEQVVGNCRPDPVATQNRTRAEVTPDLLTRLSQGRMWWNYQGHANEFVLSHESFYANQGGRDDHVLLENVDRPFLFSAFSCHANAFARAEETSPTRGTSIGEEMLTMGGRGAIGSWASSGYEILPRNGFDHVNVSWARAMFSNPPKDEILGDRGARVVLGETIQLAVLEFVTPIAGDPFEGGVGLTYHLLGDPATRLSIGAPQMVVTANGDTVANGTPVRLRTEGSSIRLEADIASNVRIDEIELTVTENGAVTPIPPSAYTLTPPFPDTDPGGQGGKRFRLVYDTTLRPFSHTYTIRTRDRYGLVSSFDVVFQFFTGLRADNASIANGDPVRPDASLQLLVLSPKPIDPLVDLTLRVGSTVQPFTPTPAAGDTTGREWLLSWTHAPYAPGSYPVELTLAGGPSATHTFTVRSDLAIENPVAFPSPFDEQSGTNFSFTLASAAPTDVLIRVYTSAGSLIYQQTHRDLLPGYHQIPWNGLDDEGQALSNGVYFYRVLASTTGSDKAEYTGRVVKLRKPTSSADDETSP